MTQNFHQIWTAKTTIDAIGKKETIVMDREHENCTFSTSGSHKETPKMDHKKQQHEHTILRRGRLKTNTLPTTRKLTQSRQ